MPRKSAITARKSTKSSSYGKRRKSETSTGKPGDIKIMMCVRDFSGKRAGKPKWVRLPGQEKLEIDLVRQWYIRMQKARAIKMVFIHGIQTCVRICYLDKIPTWFKQKITTSSPEKTIKEYFTKAKRILMCMRLHDPAGAGFLLTNASAGAAKRSQLKFKTMTSLEQQCRYFGREPKSVYDLLNMVESNLLTGDHPKDFYWPGTAAPGNKGKEEGWEDDTWYKTVAGYSKDGGTTWSQQVILCKEVAEIMKKLIFLVLRGAPVDVLLYGGYMRLKQLSEQSDVLRQIFEGKMSPAEMNAALRKQSSSVKDAHELTGGGGQGGGGSADGKKDKAYYEKLYGAMSLDELEKLEKAPPGSTWFMGLKSDTERKAFNAALAAKRKEKSTSSSGETDYAKSGDSYIMNRSRKGKGKNSSDMLGQVDFGRSRFGSPRSAMTGRGWSSGTTPMIGYVRPYRLSAMESYTGMTPRMYGNHISARTGIPTGGTSGGLSKANSYYGSYRLGEALNPTNRFGRRRRKAGHDDDEEESMQRRKRKTTKRRKTTKKRKTTKRRKTAVKKRKTAKRKTTKKRKTTRRRKTAKRSSYGSNFFF